MGENRGYFQGERWIWAWLWGRAVVFGACVLTRSLHCVSQGRIASSHPSLGTWWDEISSPWPWRVLCSSSSLSWFSTDSSSGPGELFLRTHGASGWGWQMETLVSGVWIELNSKQIIRLLPNVDIPRPQHCRFWDCCRQTRWLSWKIIWKEGWFFLNIFPLRPVSAKLPPCLLYTSDAADE
mgnify:CR=1 FL=1